MSGGSWVPWLTRDGCAGEQQPGGAAVAAITIASSLSVSRSRQSRSGDPPRLAQDDLAKRALDPSAGTRSTFRPSENVRQHALQADEAEKADRPAELDEESMSLCSVASPRSTDPEERERGDEELAQSSAWWSASRFATSA